MKLNSRKKNSLKKIWISIFIILISFLFLLFFEENLNNKLSSFKENKNIYFLNRQIIKDENSFLKKKLEELKLRNIFANYYYHRASELEDKLNYHKLNNIQRNIFSIFYSSDTNIYGSIIAINNSGKNIKINDKVYLFDNFTIGKVDSLENKLVKIRHFSDLGYKNNFIILENEKILYKGVGVGDSSGIIRVNFPRDVIPSEKSILMLDDGSQDIVGYFLKDDFRSQATERAIYYKTVTNPNTLLEVEI